MILNSIKFAVCLALAFPVATFAREIPKTRLLVFGTTTCQVCQKIKPELEELAKTRRVEYGEIDVDPKARAAFDRLRFPTNAVPAFAYVLADRGSTLTTFQGLDQWEAQKGFIYESRTFLKTPIEGAGIDSRICVGDSCTVVPAKEVLPEPVEATPNASFKSVLDANDEGPAESEPEDAVDRIADAETPAETPERVQTFAPDPPATETSKTPDEPVDFRERYPVRDAAATPPILGGRRDATPKTPGAPDAPETPAPRREGIGGKIADGIAGNVADAFDAKIRALRAVSIRLSFFGFVAALFAVVAGNLLTRPVASFLDARVKKWRARREAIKRLEAKIEGETDRTDQL